MPAPKKHASARARRNKASTAATLVSVSGAEIPSMPDGVDWHPEAIQYWQDAWSSEMSNEWLESDYHNVVMCTFLFHDFWSASTPSDRIKALAELRQQRKDLGLAPMPRRSLEWTIESAEDAKARGQKRRSATATTRKPDEGEDPRLVLVQ